MLPCQTETTRKGYLAGFGPAVNFTCHDETMIQVLLTQRIKRHYYASLCSRGYAYYFLHMRMCMLWCLCETVDGCLYSFLST